MSICVAGRFPPPIGGVSVYVSRRYANLLKTSEQVTKLDFSKKSFLFNLFNSFNFFYLHTLSKTVTMDTKLQGANITLR